MGAKFGKLFKKPAKVVIIGLDAAGKTSILYRLKLGEKVVTLPTIGFNVETIKYNKADLQIYDVGGQSRIRALWKDYLHPADAVIFVVDSAATERLEEAKDALHKVLQDAKLQHLKVLVLANKQDVRNAASITLVTEKLKMRDLKQAKWFIQPCCTTSGQGIHEGMEWLSKNL